MLDASAWGVWCSLSHTPRGSPRSQRPGVYAFASTAPVTQRPRPLSRPGEQFPCGCPYKNPTENDLQNSAECAGCAVPQIPEHLVRYAHYFSGITTMSKTIKRAALYVRVSTDHQSVENQIRELRQVAERRPGGRGLPRCRHQRRQGTRSAAGPRCLLKDAS